MCLNFSNCDLSLHLHFALFNGSKGYVIKPSEMRRTASNGTFRHQASESSASVDKKLEAADEQEDSDNYWPPPREDLHHAVIRFQSLHNLPKVCKSSIRTNLC